MQRATKIIATLGPASADPEIIEALARAGANLFRLNFSHGSHEDHASRVKSIRSVEEKLGRSLGILADLQGPKFRIGALDTPIELTAGQGLCLYLPERAYLKKRQKWRQRLCPTGKYLQLSAPNQPF